MTAIWVLILTASVMAPLLCATYAFLPLYVKQHRRRAVFTYTCAAVVALVAVMLLVCWRRPDIRSPVCYILAYGSLAGAALCFICSISLTLAKRYGWASSCAWLALARSCWWGLCCCPGLGREGRCLGGGAWLCTGTLSRETTATPACSPRRSSQRVATSQRRRQSRDVVRDHAARDL